MANNRPTLYTGVTNDLIRRIYKHKSEIIGGVKAKYHIHDLVYYELVEGELQAIIREKQIKDINRIDKLNMIKKSNPNFSDLYKQILDIDQVNRTKEDSGQARMTGV
jgi:putative endonuclease